MENSQLFQALSDNNEDDFIKLLDDQDNEKDLSMRDEHGRTLFHNAILKIKSVNIFKALLEKADFSVRDDEGNTAIDLAFDDEDFPDEIEEVFREYLRRKIRESAKDDLWGYLRRGWILNLLFNDDDKTDDDKEEVKEFVGKLPDKLASPNA